MVQAACGRKVKAGLRTGAPHRLTRSATVGDRLRPSRHGSSIVPQIRLTGQWLAEAGFNIGDKLTVQVNHQQIYISRRARP